MKTCCFPWALKTIQEHQDDPETIELFLKLLEHLATKTDNSIDNELVALVKYRLYTFKTAI